MTVLSTIQNVCTSIGLDVPSAVYGATSDRELLELANLANEMAERIAKTHEWTGLQTVHTVTGDATTEAHALPSDFDRFPIDCNVWLPSQDTPATRILNTNEWLERQIRDLETLYNSFIIIGKSIHILPVLSATETAKFYYLQNTYANANDSTRKAAFSADTDTFVLDERVLKLGMIWQWRENKGLPYAEDMANYEIALSKQIMADGGSPALMIGAPRLPTDADIAYPFTLSDA